MKLYMQLQKNIFKSHFIGSGFYDVVKTLALQLVVQLHYDKNTKDLRPSDEERHINNGTTKVGNNKMAKGGHI